MAPLHHSCGQHARRSGWAGICKTCLHTRSKSTNDRIGSKPDLGLAIRYRHTGLDERQNQKAGDCKVECVYNEDWLSRQVARLFGTEINEGIVLWQPGAGGPVRVELSASEDL